MLDRMWSSWMQKIVFLLKVMLKRLTVFASHVHLISEQAQLQDDNEQNSPEIQPVQPVTQIPGPRPSLPFIGTSWIYGHFGYYKTEKLHEANFDKMKRYGKIMREEYQWGCPLIQIFDPHDIEQVMRHQGRCPIRPANEAVCMYRKQNPDKYKSTGLVNEQGEKWYELRNKLTSALTRQKTMLEYLPAQNEILDDFLRLMKYLQNDKNEVTDFISNLYRLALESVVMLCLDTRLGCLDVDLSPDSEAQQMITATYEMFEAFQELYYGLPYWKYIETAAYKKMAKSHDTTFRIASKYIDRTIEKLQEMQTSGCLEDSERGLTILASLLSKKDLDIKDIRMTMIDFIVAGIDTVSNSLLFLFYQLARHPEVQQKLYNELDAAFPFRSSITSAVMNLPYLKACIKETYRFSPTIPNSVRVLPEDTVLQNYHIPALTPIICHTQVASRLPEYFENPDEFIPERWLGENGTKVGHPYAVLPFGSGPRMCVGKRFAEQEIYTTVAKMVLNFTIECENENLSSIYRFILVPDQPVTFRLLER